ncbi:MAG: hypothetical protein QOI42_2177 [Frankiaceae bacterium]|nr:hypothetical protein [Frankiaceae bacterium]
MVLLAIAAVIDALSVWVDLSQASLLAALRDGTRRVTLAQAQASDHRVAAFSGATLLVVIAVAACLMTWLWQSVRFQQVVLRRPSRFSRGWAIGAWFVPFLSLVRPKQIVDDVWENATAVAYAGQPRPRTLLHAWWAFYIGNGLFAAVSVIGNGGSTAASATERLQTLVRGAQLSTISDGLSAVAAVLAVTWLARLTRAQAAAEAIATEAARQHWAAYGVMPGAPSGPPGQWTVPPYGQAPYGQAGPYGPPAAPRPAQWPPPPPPRRAEWPAPSVPPSVPAPAPAPAPADWPQPGTPSAAPRPAQWPPPPAHEHTSPPQSPDEPQMPDSGSGRTADGQRDV